MKHPYTLFFWIFSTICFFQCQSFHFVQVGTPDFDDIAHRMIYTFKGQFIVAGQVSDQAVLYKVDCDGALLDSFLFPGLDVNSKNSFTDIIQLPNSQLVAVGYSDDGIEHNIIIAHLQSNFSPIATSQFRLSDSQAKARRVIRLNETDLALFGEIEGDELDAQDAFYQRIELSTLQAIGPPSRYSFGVDELKDAIMVSDSQLVFCGGSRHDSICGPDTLTHTAWVAAIDTAGQLKWQRKIEQHFPVRFGQSAFAALSRKFNPPKILAAGITYSGDSLKRLMDPFYLWLDSDGQVLDTMSFPMEGQQRVFSLLPTLANRFLSAGDSMSIQEAGKRYTLINSIGVAGDSLSVIRSNFFVDKLQTPYHLSRKPNGLIFGVGTSMEPTTPTTNMGIALPRPYVNLYPNGDTLESKIFTSSLDFQWRFEGILLPSEKSNWMIPQEKGNYTLTVSDPDGCSASSTYFWDIDTVEMESPALFKASPNPACTERLINFLYIVNDAAAYHWDFGDGETSTSPDPGFVRYPDTNLYPINLTIETFPGQRMIDEISLLSIPGFCCDPIFDPVPKVYVRLRDENGSLRYSSRAQAGQAISTIPTAMLLFPDREYTLEFWEFDLLSNDDFLGSFTFGGNTIETAFQQGDLQVDFRISAAAPSYTYTEHVQLTAPVIIPLTDTLLADVPYLGINAAARFQWYLDGVPIADATDQHFVPQTAGEYTVKFSQGSCLNTFSQPYLWGVTASREPALATNQSFRIFPNPQQAGESIRLVFQHDKREAGVLAIYGSHGQILRQSQYELRAGANELLLQVPTVPGLYLLQLRSRGGKEQIGKLLVQ